MTSKPASPRSEEESEEVITIQEDVTFEDTSPKSPQVSTSIRELKTIQIDPDLRIRPETQEDKTFFDIMQPNCIKATSFTSAAVTSRYQTRAKIDTLRSLLSISFLTRKMKRAHFFKFFMTGYEKAGTSNPDFISRLATQACQTTIQHPMFSELLDGGVKIDTPYYEIGYAVFDQHTKTTVVNRLTPHMSKTNWSLQPEPNINFSNDGNHNCLFHIIIHLRYQLKAPPRKTTRDMSTELHDMPQMNTVIDNTRSQADAIEQAQYNASKNYIKILHSKPYAEHRDPASSAKKRLQPRLPQSESSSTSSKSPVPKAPRY